MKMGEGPDWARRSAMARKLTGLQVFSGVAATAAGNQESRKRRQATGDQQKQAGVGNRGRKNPPQAPAERQTPAPADPEQMARGIRASGRVVGALLFEH